jgi:pimeloyl-ACP methyl ester carboxylesterase
MTVRVTSVGREARGSAVIEDLGIDAGVDPPLVAYRVTPDGTSGPPGPALLAWHWFDTQADDSDRTQFLDEAVELAGLGVTTLLPQGRFPWASAPSGAAGDVAAIEAEVARIHAGLDVLRATPRVDASRLALVGHDFGGMLAAVAAPDVADLRALVIIAATPRWGDWFLPFWPIAGDRWDYLRALAPVDPITRIPELAPRPVCLQFAKGDFFIADMTGLELHRAAGEPKEIHAYEADHGVRHPQARADRLAFLRRTLSL